MAQAKANIEEHFVVVGLLEKVTLICQRRKIDIIEKLTLKTKKDSLAVGTALSL